MWSILRICQPKFCNRLQELQIFDSYGRDCNNKVLNLVIGNYVFEFSMDAKKRFLIKSTPMQDFEFEFDRLGRYANLTKRCVKRKITNVAIDGPLQSPERKKSS